jgi:hypothetical protein
MDPKYQLTSNNDYTPSKRASAAVSKGNSSGGYTPDHADEASVTSDHDVLISKDVDGGSPPSEKAQEAARSDVLDNPKSLNDRKA